jgi:hypothetical protein
MKEKCPCGEEATNSIRISSNIFAGIREIMEEKQVCEYHFTKFQNMKEKKHNKE